MRIGIDLDNTIIDYTPAFQSFILKNKILKRETFFNSTETINKSFLKSEIIKLKNGNLIWQKIQGQIYGKHISLAKIFPGFHRFLLLSKNRKFELFIVSHKTKFGHFDKDKTPLRDAALNFLKKNNILKNNYSNLNKNNIFFADTRDNKIELINKLKFDYFIDDLPEVLLHHKFNKKTVKILINSKNNIKNNRLHILYDWGKINNYLFKNFSDMDIKIKLSFLKISKIEKINKIKGGINSKVYKVKNKNKEICFKIYPISNERRNRHNNEFNAFNFLRKNKIYSLPKPLMINDNLQIAIYSWINGKKPKILDKENIKNLINFVTKLKIISDKTSIKNFNEASESSVNLLNIYNYNNKRIESLKYSNNGNKELLNHLKIIDQCNNKNNVYLEKFLSKENISTKLLKKDLILSPSDVSLKNILCHSGKDYYIDFEYFGWDDPCKTLSDIIWHPSMNLGYNKYKYLINKFSIIFKNDKYFKKRLISTFNLYGVRWSLIMLNLFNNYNFKNAKNSKKMNIQLQKSKKTIENVLYDKYKNKYLIYENI